MIVPRSALLTALFAVLASGSVAIRAETPLTTVRVASGFSLPLLATAPPGDRDRLFVVEQRGRIRIVRDGVVLDPPFLDISALVSQTGNERGLLGLAFHPDYAENGWFYVNYTRAVGHATMVARYSVSADDPDAADPASATPILGPLAQPFSNHNGGCLAFGPDGKLYVSTGDGGSGGDPLCLAQQGQTLLGKILRLEDDGSVPADNPFVGDPAFADEIWAYGLRNPWRFSFDRETGDMYIGDVGQRLIEEIDVIPASSAGGQNFGWKVMEGTSCFGTRACPVETPTCNDPTLVPPIHEYTHALGCSVTGGHVYRGCAIPDLRGDYVFGDFCRATIWSLEYDGQVAQNVRDRTAELASGGGPRIDLITSFGEDADGEILVVDRGGEIFRIVPDAEPPAVDLGFGRPGGNGEVPELDACGLLTEGNEALVRLRGAPPHARATLLVGATSLIETGHEGPLVPARPRLSRKMTTDENGEIELVLPGGGGPRVLYVQFRIADPGADRGRSLSNGLRLTWPAPPADGPWLARGATDGGLTSRSRSGRPAR